MTEFQNPNQQNNPCLFSLVSDLNKLIIERMKRYVQNKVAGCRHSLHELLYRNIFLILTMMQSQK